MWTALQVAFGLAGLAFLVVSFVDAWQEARSEVVPAAWRLGGGVALAGVGLACGARGWSTLLGVRRRPITAGFLVAQLGKYIPGGVWQIAGQVGFARKEGVSLGRASAAFPVHALSHVAAGGLLALGYVALGSGPRRWVGLLGLLTLPLLHRAWMLAAARVVARVSGREFRDDIVPPQRAVLEATGWSLATLLATGTAFALVAPGIDAPARAVVPAWGAAWTVGFLMLVFPAGLGIREAALVAALGPFGSTAGVVSASVIHRIVTMAAEVAMVGGTQVWAGAGRGARGGAGADPADAPPDP